MPSVLRRRWRQALGAALAVVALLLGGLALALQHATPWLRPLVQQFARSHAGRHIDFATAQIGLDSHWQPRIRLRQLTIDNAPWAADAQPLIVAGQVEFTLTWASVLAGWSRARRIELPLLSIADAEIHLQRRADGLRNWRLAHPDDRGPGRARAGVLLAERTRLHLLHEGIGLDLTLASTPLPTPRAAAGNAALLLTQQLRFDGTRHGLPFHGQTAATARLSLLDSNEPFALADGSVQTAGARLAVSGSGRNLLTLDELELDLQLAGARPAELALVLGAGTGPRANAAPAAATRASAHLHKAGPAWVFTGLQASVGRSDLAGSLTLTQRSSSTPRPRVDAVLSSRRIDLADWLPATPAHEAAAGGVAGSGLNRLADVDADIGLRVATLDTASAASASASAPPLTQLRAHAALQAGQLRLDAVSFDLFGGHVSGSATLDAARAPAAATLALRATGVRLDQIGAWSQHKALQSLTGRLDAQAQLRFNGSTGTAWAASTSGDVQAQLQQATVPRTLDAQWALDGGAWLRALFSGSRDAVPVTCAAASMHFDNGSGHSRQLAIDTERVALSGSASVNLGQRTLNVVLTPQRKQAALLALDRSLQWQGSFDAPRLKLVDAVAAPASAGCRAAVVTR